MRALFVLSLACIAGFITVSCTPSQYLRSANKETDKIIDTKGSHVPNMDEDFSIATPDPPSLVQLATNKKTHNFLGDQGNREKGARVVTLADALAISVEQNREYRNTKELLYLQALDLTLARHQFDNIFSASGEATLGGREAARSASSLAGDAVADSVNTIVRDNTLAGNAALGFSALRKLGTRLSADLTGDFLSFISGDFDALNRSSFVASLAQPLLRGAGYRATTETLTQAERSLLYAIRDFSRFRKEFSVQIASSYYQVLRTRDSVRNNFAAYKGFQLSLEREEGFYEEGKTSLTELGLIKQATYQAESRWVSALSDYEEALDQFKIDLGVPIDSRVVLDETELDKLEIIPPELGRAQAADLAVYTRLDLQNSVDRYGDTARRIRVFKQNLLPSVDFVSDIEIDAAPIDGIPEFDFDTNQWDAGLNIDLQLDNKEERNEFRASLIAHQTSIRELDLAVDQVKKEIYDNWRSLEQAERQYEIARNSVQLASQRLEEQQIRMDIGQGTARDLVEAQNDLNESQNQLTAALVAHTVARLNFWRDMGILFISKDGSWIKKLQEEEATYDRVAQKDRPKQTDS